MTAKEAIEILRETPIDIRSTREDDIHTLYATAIIMAQDALEKQVPRKPQKVLMLETYCKEKYKIGLSSCCGRWEGEYSHYCSKRGQAIDWEDE